MAQLAPQAVADDLPERARLLEMAARLDPEYVQLGYQIAVHGRQELPLAPDEQAGFIMTLLRLYTFRPAQSSDAERPRAPLAAVKAVAASPVAKVADSAPVLAPRVAEPEPPSLSPESVASAIAVSPSPEPVADRESGDWHAILAALKLGGMARELGQHCQLQRIDGAQAVLCLSPTHRHLLMKPAQDKLQQSLAEYFGRPLQLSIELHETVGDTPAATAQRRKHEQQEHAVASIEQDGFVREVIDVFDATLIESSIKPV